MDRYFTPLEIEELKSIYEYLRTHHNRVGLFIPTCDLELSPRKLITMTPGPDFYEAWLWSLYNNVLATNNVSDSLNRGLSICINSSPDERAFNNAMNLLGRGFHCHYINSEGRWARCFQATNRPAYIIGGKTKLLDAINDIDKGKVTAYITSVHNIEYITINSMKYVLVIEWELNDGRTTTPLVSIFNQEASGQVCLHYKWYRDAQIAPGLLDHRSDGYMFTQEPDYTINRGLTNKENGRYVYINRILWTLAQEFPLYTGYYNISKFPQINKLNKPFGKTWHEVAEDLKQLIKKQLDNITEFVAEVKEGL